MEKLETVVTSFLRKICSEVTIPNFETSSSYLESGATFHSLRSCKRTRISLREILVCSTLNKVETSCSKIENTSFETNFIL